ncbi:MAG: type I-B CRISPR-associated protein Cas7/Csh2 [Dictyoglomus sp.]|uniref:CRISPR-associated protein, Csh2 family n=1 Tax=Dictyoglomus turgidum (strain DSM 6724 / Z-1310) TaxID=515635 RepID=B8DZH8_DICTD|nr:MULTISPECIES: type I-B CRISPR-associated protein Cas7/Csh2 [Dictyoglomus]ACK41911.1 CRISPR-associated protein, Csh2 family [Dictyoglomus turgidum DSM 6724]HBU31532.1 type I-B CRISPR-associated protein Cas7/Csh2 [Dictyoglomus sp.]
MTELKNRSELLFLYDVTDANPNGDPVDENKPRIDEETGVNIVTDVRLKRTIRDYLYEYKGLEVFIREIRKEDGKLKTKEERLEEFKSNQEVIEKCIDIRLFGATTAVEGKTMALTGPVQFKYGRSLHRVDLTYIKGTTVMPSGAEKTQGTFTEKYILPYSLIAFYGIVNDNLAKVQNIPLTQEDVDYMLEAMWHGTKNLISGSKFGQVPRLLIQIVYKPDSYFYIGELNRRIKLISDIEDEKIRDISQVKIDISDLAKALEENKGKIEKIRYKVDERLRLVKDGMDTSLTQALSQLSLEELSF